MSESKLNMASLRKLNDDVLLQRFRSLKKELFNLRFQKTSGELTNTSRFIIVRRSIARVATELNVRKREVRVNV